MLLARLSSKAPRTVPWIIIHENPFDAIIESLKSLAPDETLLVQSGKPVGIATTTVDSPRVIIANSNLVPHWATQEHFDDLEARGLMMYGQMTAGSWNDI